MSDDETTVRWRDTNTAIELDDLGASNNSVQQNREEEANEYPGPFGLACKILLGTYDLCRAKALGNYTLDS